MRRRFWFHAAAVLVSLEYCTELLPRYVHGISVLFEVVRTTTIKTLAHVLPRLFSRVTSPTLPPHAMRIKNNEKKTAGDTAVERVVTVT